MPKTCSAHLRVVAWRQQNNSTKSTKKFSNKFLYIFLKYIYYLVTGKLRTNRGKSVTAWVVKWLVQGNAPIARRMCEEEGLSLLDFSACGMAADRDGRDKPALRVYRHRMLAVTHTPGLRFVR